jgi:hypothetical protein
MSEDISQPDHIHLTAWPKGSRITIIDEDYDGMGIGSTIDINKEMHFKEEAKVRLVEIDEGIFDFNDDLGTITIPAASTNGIKVIDFKEDSWFERYHYRLRYAVIPHKIEIADDPVRFIIDKLTAEENIGSSTPPNHNPPFIPNEDDMIMPHQKKEREKIMGTNDKDALDYVGDINRPKSKGKYHAMGGYSDEWRRP